MFISLKDIHFESRTVGVHITSCTDSQERSLDAYLTRCSEVGYGVASVSYPTSTPAEQLTRLQHLAKKWHITLLSVDATNPPDPSRPHSHNFEFLCVSAPTTTDPRQASVDYRLRCHTFDDVLNVTTHFVVLVGASIPLDSRLLSRLRLGVYELTVNTIEHAKFVEPTPQIDIVLQVTPDTIVAVYQDNATVFNTDNHDAISIENKINTGDKRGLGLSMIAKLSADLKFERKGKWNRTTFIIDRHHFVSK